MKVHIDGYDFEAEDMQDGVLIDPVVPEGFEETPNDERPASHDKFWHRPFIDTRSYGDVSFVVVRCLDGGAWDRPTMCGRFPTIPEAVQAINQNMLRQCPELEFEMAAMFGLAMKVERLRTIEGWVWTIEDRHRQQLDGGLEETRGEAVSAAASAANYFAMLAERPAQWSARYDGDS